MPELSRILTALDAAPDEPAALATLVRVEGSSYRRPGARLLVLGSGLRVGSISGGCLEDDVVLRAQRVLAGGTPETAVYDTTSENDLVWGVGLGCQGVVHIFIERLPVIRPRWINVLDDNLRARRDTALAIIHGGDGTLGTCLDKDLPAGIKSLDIFQEKISAPPALTIFGAGEDACPLVQLAKEVGWHVTVADSRPAYATTARFPGADQVVIAPAKEAAGLLAHDHSGFAVVMTHRYAEDLELLRRLLPHPLAYLGVLGPHKRTARLIAQLRTEGLSPDAAMLARLHAPIGLDLGGNTPETVALAIVAEIQCRFTARNPIHLRDRTTPIHG
jgi:xanthine/CO dehydrogenase XdhC/CoxF family maturation factor